MPDYTPNYNLKKPLGNENYTVDDQNGNMDIVDQTLKENADNLTSHKADMAKYAFFTRNTAQSTASSTNTQILFETKDSFNSEEFCLLESGRIKILQKGLYEFVAYTAFAPNGTGNRFINNGFRIDGTPSQGASVQTLFATSWFKECNVDELVAVIVNQTSGGALDLVGSQVRVRRVAKL